jgi:predicted transcriptional regulator
MDSKDLIQLTADIVAAHVENNIVTVGDLPFLIGSVHSALAGLGSTSKPAPTQEPAVSIRSSIKPDHLVCLEDGKKVKMLKRHLKAEHGLTPDEYRAKWNLPTSYPMVAPNYAEQRKQLALQIGLGKTRRGPAKRPKRNGKKAGG